VADDAVTTPPARFPPQGGLRHLTFNLGPDVTPLWSQDGTTLSYVAQGLPPTTAGQWRRWSVPAEGGVATEDQAAYRPTVLTEPLPIVRAPSGTRAALAFLRMSGVYCFCSDEPWPTVGSIVVAAVDLAAPPLAFDALPQLDLPLAGLTPSDTTIIRTPDTLANRRLHRVRLTPAFARRRDDLSAVFGPSWSPAGERLVVSDGDLLWIWTVASGALDTVPGVRDAAFPRWSPDGAKIAFTRYPQDSTRRRLCFIPADGDFLCFADHRITVRTTPEAWVVAPDGSGLTRVGDGEESAWLPSSDALLVSRTTGLVLIDLATGAERALANTVGAREPSVSPDGRRAAFVARFSGNLDLWTVELSP
jgi:Tol biopolymer transport system component